VNKETFVQAGAGAGKTTRLVAEVLNRAENYFKKHMHFPKIWLSTFTVKATQELKVRMLEECLKGGKEHLVPFVQSSHTLKISTLHGLFDSFLRKNTMEGDLPNTIDYGSSYLSQSVRVEALKKVFKENDHWSGLVELFGFRFILKIFGKMEKFSFEENIVFAQVPDFSNLALKEKGRLDKRISKLIENLQVEKSGDERWEDYIQSWKGFLQISPESWKSIRSGCEARLEGFPRRPSKKKTETPLQKFHVKEMDSLKKKLKEFAFDPSYKESHWIEIAKQSQDLAASFSVYKEKLLDLKRQEGFIEISDLENLTWTLLHENPELGETFSKNWDYVFIDEYQDTSPLQSQILKRLFANTESFYVGDPQQSIYLFRGADENVFLSKKDQVSRSNQGQLEFLENNYRSREELILFFNWLFPQLAPNFKSIIPKKSRGEGSAILIHKQNEDMEEEIQQLVKAVKNKIEQGVSPAEIAILVRKKSQGQWVEKALVEADLPVLNAGGSYISQREVKDCLCLLSVLLFPSDNKAWIEFFRAPWVPISDQEIVDLCSKVQLSEDLIFFQAKEFLCKRESLFWPQFFSDIENVSKKSLTFTFQKYIRCFQIIETWNFIEPSGRAEANIWKFIHKIHKIVRTPGASLGALYEELLRIAPVGLGPEEKMARSAHSSEQIQVMTIHKSKGLQFDWVFVPFLNNRPTETNHLDFIHDEKLGLTSLRVPIHIDQAKVSNPLEKAFIPNLRDQERSESLRVFYVALTRARQGLYLSWDEKVKANSWASHLEPCLDQLSATQINEFAIEYIESSKGHLEALSPDTVVDATVSSPGEENKDAKLRNIIVQGAKKSVFESGSQDRLFMSSEADETQFVARAEKRALGTWVHRVLETLDYQDKEQALAMVQLQNPKYFLLIQEIFEDLEKIKEFSFFTGVQEGFSEWKFTKKTKDGLVSEGRIDLWFIQDETLWVVDYKTGSSGYSEKAFEQVGNYAAILYEIPKIRAQFKDVQLGVLYLMEKKSFFKKWVKA